MASSSNLMKLLHLQTRTPIPNGHFSSPISFSKTIFFFPSSSLSVSNPHLSLKNPYPPHHHHLGLICCSLPKTHDELLMSSSPPTTREEAIAQAQLSLSSVLKKPLNNPAALFTFSSKKRLSQPRYRVEIPLIDDDSPTSLSRLALDVFATLPITVTTTTKKRGSKTKSAATVLILWPNPSLSELAREAFNSTTTVIINSDIDSVTAAESTGLKNSCDFAVFMAPEASQLEDIKVATDTLYPKPVVLFNPKWGFDEEKEFQLGGFVGSFDVVYSFMGLEVKGIIKRRKGVVFRCVKDGVVSGGGEGWVVMVEDDDDEDNKAKGRMKVVSRFKRRPTIAEVESVLYNVMAANSPVTKSIKFLKDLASNVTGKKLKQ